MSDIDLIACCESFGIGVELVQSIYKGWTFKLPDTVAGFGLHGQYKICLLYTSDAADDS